MCKGCFCGVNTAVGGLRGDWGLETRLSILEITDKWILIFSKWVLCRLGPSITDNKFSRILPVSIIEARIIISITLIVLKNREKVEKTVYLNN